MSFPPATQNRFAGLKIDDDDDDTTKSRKSASNQNQSNATGKKKNKKKAKEADEELRNMAFGGARPGPSRPPKKGAQQRSLNNKPVSTEDWDAWQQRDEKSMEDRYEQDLTRAMLESQLEAEQNAAVREMMKAAGEPSGQSTDGGKKKKKKKDKPQTMSLDQFNQLPPERLPDSDDENEDPVPEPVQMSVPIACQDKHYFDRVNADANKQLQKERIQEQYQKAYAHESAMQSKYQDDLEKRDQKIKELEASLANQAAELKVVKARNMKFCRILADGEMKEKSAILMQVDELTTEKADLTEQLSAVTADLEKERSKTRALKQENDKLKAKHGK